VLGSADITPFSSRLDFVVFFLGLSTLSAMGRRVYGYMSGRGARPRRAQGTHHDFRRAVLLSGSISRARAIDDENRSS
jgi:hypothetical protein